VEDRILSNISSSSVQRSTPIKVFSILSRSKFTLRLFVIEPSIQLIDTVSVSNSRSFAAGTNAWTATEVRRRNFPSSIFRLSKFRGFSSYRLPPTQSALPDLKVSSRSCLFSLIMYCIRESSRYTLCFEPLSRLTRLCVTAQSPMLDSLQKFSTSVGKVRKVELFLERCKVENREAAI